jgi:ketosteroid isomerase-like protein
MNFNTKGLVFFALLMGLAPSISFSQSDAEERQAILAMMRLEEKYWNSGDIDAYVSLYAPEDSVRMIYDKGAIYGKDNILAFYKKYWPKEKMGQLTLDGERLERLSDEYYYNSGYFHVRQNDGKLVEGRFSGLMKKIDGKWYIYVDHSS